MDPSFIIGVLGATVVVIVGIILEGGIGGLVNFWSLSSVFVVLGGVIFAVVACFPLSVLKNVPMHLKIALTGTLQDPTIYIDQIVECAQLARKNGLLALEEYANQQEDAFLRSSLLLIVDAVDADKVRSVLENDLANMEARHNEAVSIYERGAALSPAFGMIGTLIGLIMMLNNIDLDSGDSSKLTSGMAVALITTFYGSLLANVLFMPISSKLQVRNEREALCREIVIEGILAIQAGENPKFIREKLMAFLSEKMKAQAGDEGGGQAGGGEGAGDEDGGKKSKKKEKKEKKKK